ncbi:MAG: hypothetical protein ABRQ37_02825 [Candidatus Eremiobacterota bacterium]
MSNENKEQKKSAGISFIQALNTPKTFTSSTSGAWNLMKNRMMKSEVEDGESDGSDVFEAEKEKNKERDGLDNFQSKEETQGRDGRDNFQSAALLVSHTDGLDGFQEKDREEVKEKNKVDKWERHYTPPVLPGEDIVVRGEEIKFKEQDIFSSSSNEKEGLSQESDSALYIQFSRLIPALEQKLIPFEKRQTYLKEIETYIERKKKSLNRLYNLKNPSEEKIKSLIDRGFNVFLQSLSELGFYLRDDSHIHLTLAGQLSSEGNNLFLKARKELTKKHV